MKVSLRAARVEDAEAMVAVMEPESLRNFQFFEDFPTVQRQREYIRKMRNSYQDCLCAIVHEECIVGTCGLHEVDFHHKNARLGIMLFARKFRGQGLASDAMRQLIYLAFRELGLYKVYLKVFAENTASATKYAHIGLQFEVRLRKNYLLRGIYHDMVVMSTFADEWHDPYQN